MALALALAVALAVGLAMALALALAVALALALAVALALGLAMALAVGLAMALALGFLLGRSDRSEQQDHHRAQGQHKQQLLHEALPSSFIGHIPSPKGRDSSTPP